MLEIDDNTFKLIVRERSVVSLGITVSFLFVPKGQQKLFYLLAKKLEKYFQFFVLLLHKRKWRLLTHKELFKTFNIFLCAYNKLFSAFILSENL